MNRDNKTTNELLHVDQRPANSNSTHAATLRQLSIEFSSFTAFYTGFCNTLAKVLIAGQPLDAGTVEGINRSCRWLEHRLTELHAEMALIARED